MPEFRGVEFEWDDPGEETVLVYGPLFNEMMGTFSWTWFLIKKEDVKWLPGMTGM